MRIINPIILTAVILILASPASEAKGIDFLVPGVSLDSVKFEPGTEVEYMIVSEAYGVLDTTVVGLSVRDSDGNLYQLEIISSTWPAREEETVRVMLELGCGIKEAKDPGEVRSFISGVSVKDGREPWRQATEEEIEEFDIEHLFITGGEEKEKKLLGTETVGTPAGSFTCEVTEYLKSDRRTVKLGGVDAERYEEEKTILKLSGAVPFWGLVTSRIERSSSTSLKSTRLRRKPQPRVTVTESILLSFRR